MTVLYKFTSIYHCRAELSCVGGIFLTLSMRHPEPPDWMNLFISVLRALFFQHEWSPKPLMVINFLCMLAAQWALMVFHSCAVAQPLTDMAPIAQKTLTLINGQLAAINVKNPRGEQISTCEAPPEPSEVRKLFSIVTRPPSKRNLFQKSRNYRAKPVNSPPFVIRSCTFV